MGAYMMTDLLDKAFEEASRLSQEEQDEIAIFILEELKSERKWVELLSSSPDKLADMAKEARREHESGETEPLHSKTE
jgi:hypothetical protein